MHLLVFLLFIFAGLQEIFGNSNLLSLIQEEKANAAKFLLTYGKLSQDDLNAASTSGEYLTPLLASLNGDMIPTGMEEVAIMLIRKGADLNRKKRGTLETALHLAVENRLPRVVHALLGGKIDLGARNSHGYTPLHCCVDSSIYVPSPESGEILRLLLKAGSELNEDSNSKTMTPLHIAAHNSNYMMANALLAKGADPNSLYINDPPVYGLKRFMTPLEILLAMNENTFYHRNCVVSLLNYGADVSADQADVIMTEFWDSSQALVGGTFECFDDYVFAVTEDICRLKDLKEGVGSFDESVPFALYRLLKALYVREKHGERSSHLEEMKLQYFDHILILVVKGTYLETLPQEMVSDVIYLAGFYGWNIERVSWNVAFISRMLKMDEVESREVAHKLFLDLERKTFIENYTRIFHDRIFFSDFPDGIDMVKISDPEAALKYNVINTPALVYFRKRVPLVYDGDLFDEDKILTWLTSQDVFEIKNEIEEVNRKMLDKLLDENEFLVVYFYERNSASSMKVLDKLERIDGETDDMDIIFVKMADTRYARKWGVTKLPAVVYFRHRFPSIYRGELESELEVLEWLRKNRYRQPELNIFMYALVALTLAFVIYTVFLLYGFQKQKPA